VSAFGNGFVRQMSGGRPESGVLSRCLTSPGGCSFLGMGSFGNIAGGGEIVDFVWHLRDGWHEARGGCRTARGVRRGPDFDFCLPLAKSGRRRSSESSFEAAWYVRQPSPLNLSQSARFTSGGLHRVCAAKRGRAGDHRPADSVDRSNTCGGSGRGLSRAETFRVRGAGPAHFRRGGTNPLVRHPHLCHHRCNLHLMVGVDGLKFVVSGPLIFFIVGV
jgi:hypothetical protein